MVLDMPGARYSRATDESTLSFDEHITAVRRVIDELDLSSYGIVGDDSGGLIARRDAPVTSV